MCFIFLRLTDLPFLAFRKKQGKPPKKARIFLSSEPLKSLGKKGKTLKKARKFLATKQARKSKKARKGRSGLRRQHINNFDPHLFPGQSRKLLMFIGSSPKLAYLWVSRQRLFCCMAYRKVRKAMFQIQRKLGLKHVNFGAIPTFHKSCYETHANMTILLLKNAPDSGAVVLSIFLGFPFLPRFLAVSFSGTH